MMACGAECLQRVVNAWGSYHRIDAWVDAMAAVCAAHALCTGFDGVGWGAAPPTKSIGLCVLVSTQADRVRATSTT